MTDPEDLSFREAIRFAAKEEKLLFVLFVASLIALPVSAFRGDWVWALVDLTLFCLADELIALRYRLHWMRETVRDILALVGVPMERRPPNH